MVGRTPKENRFGRGTLTMRHKATIIIPARLGSTRFPRKVLADATGQPLIQHVFERAGMAECAHRVVIATDSDEVAAAVERFGGEAILTSPDHPNGTSRVAEAARKLNLDKNDIVVNAQGDEPELEPEMIDAAVDILATSSAPIATAAIPFAEGEDPTSPNLVKVVLSADGTALYFSRALIPFVRDPGADRPVRPLKHIGLYIYRRWFLDEYLNLPPTLLESTEQLEQLRVLYHNRRIAVAVLNLRTHGGIDTPEQYEAFLARWRSAQRA